MVIFSGHVCHPFHCKECCDDYFPSIRLVLSFKQYVLFPKWIIQTVNPNNQNQVSLGCWSLILCRETSLQNGQRIEIAIR
jgi:hypothetical protein